MQRQGSGGKSKGKQAAMDVRMSGGDSSASQSDDETMAIVISDSDDESEEEEEVDPIARAAELKMTGNEYYKEKNYLQALVHYKEAVQLDTNNVALYGNIAATCLMMERFDEALKAAETGIKTDPSFVKNYLRAGKAALSLGKFAEAKQYYTEVVKREPKNTTAAAEKRNIERVDELSQHIAKALEKDQFSAAMYKAQEALKLAPHATRLVIALATCMLGLNKHAEANDVVTRVLRKERSNPDALYIRSRCLMKLGNVENAMIHLKNALRSAPDHTLSAKYLKKLKNMEKLRAKAKEAFGARDYLTAEQLYTDVLDLLSDEKGELVAKIYCNRALTKTKTGRKPEGILDCTEAIKAHSAWTKAYALRAQTYMETEMYEEAVRDYTHLAEDNQEYRKQLQNAKTELKKSKRKDYYKILDCPKDANEQQIKKCYKKAALRNHPDKVQGDDKVKEEAVKKIKDINEAFGVLGDAKKRRMYDQGYDLEEINNGGPTGHGFGGAGGFGGGVDISDLFAHMSAQGGGHGFGGGRGGGGFNFSF